METDRPELSLVIPVFNEEDCLPLLLERLAGLKAPLEGVRMEVIFVDDHSNDATERLLDEACKANADYRYIRLARNQGSNVAILAGLEHARGRCASFLCADLQDPPELLPQMLEAWRDGAHIVWAVRTTRADPAFLSAVFGRLFYALMNRFSRVDLPPDGSDFVLMDRRALSALLVTRAANPSLIPEIAGLGFRAARVPYEKSKRAAGKSKWNLRRKLAAFADAFVGFSYAPLRLMSYLGLVCSTIGMCYAMVVVGIRLSGSEPIPGWASLMVVLLVIGGVQMTMLGVVGEYLWRTLEESRRRPLYHLESWEGFEEERVFPHGSRAAESRSSS